MFPVWSYACIWLQNVLLGSGRNFSLRLKRKAFMIWFLVWINLRSLKASSWSVFLMFKHYVYLNNLYNLILIFLLQFFLILCLTLKFNYLFLEGKKLKETVFHVSFGSLFPKKESEVWSDVMCQSFVFKWGENRLHITPLIFWS
jgi:hypothetical protein